MKNEMQSRNFKKIKSISVKTIISNHIEYLPKPNWMKIKLPVNLNRIQHIKSIMRDNHLHSICEEASCPNLTECFNHGTASFLILGSICTRRCPFCNVTHGRPLNVDLNEPIRLAKTIIEMNLSHVVITSVNRDDLHDGGAQQFSNCIHEIRTKNSKICIEILVPDFRGCMQHALNIINTVPPDIFNHNLENIPRLYHKIRPGADYYRSLRLLELFKKYNQQVPTKSGLMVGLGETNNEIIKVMQDLYNHGVTMLTIGQYLQPSRYHVPVHRYVHPREFEEIQKEATAIGFTHIFCGPFVRSSYHADLQIKNIAVK